MGGVRGIILREVKDYFQEIIQDVCINRIISVKVKNKSPGELKV